MHVVRDEASVCGLPGLELEHSGRSAAGVRATHDCGAIEPTGAALYRLAMTARSLSLASLLLLAASACDQVQALLGKDDGKTEAAGEAKAGDAKVADAKTEFMAAKGIKAA